MPIGPFRAWLRREAVRAGSTEALCKALDVSWGQMLRWLKHNKWVAFDTVDRIMVARNQMWTDIYTDDDLVSSATARNFDGARAAHQRWAKERSSNGGNANRQVPAEERVHGKSGA